MKVVNYITLSLSLFLLGACAGSGKPDEAQMLVAQADSAIKAKDFSGAIEILDTLKSRYPDKIESQRQGMHLRPIAIEGKTIRELQVNDSLLAYYSHVKDSLTPDFKFIDNPALVEGYYVIKEYANSTLFSRNGAEARISPEGEFYLISSLVSNPVKHTSISLESKDGKATTATVAYDGERNYRYGNTEMITFTGTECDTLGAFLNKYPDTKVTIVFKGTKDARFPLSAGDRRSIALTYKMAEALSQERKLNLRHEYLERQLMLARDQAARTSEQEKE